MYSFSCALVSEGEGVGLCFFDGFGEEDVCEVVESAHILFANVIMTSNLVLNYLLIKVICN